MKESEALIEKISSTLMKKFKVKELNEQQKNVVNSFAKVIINSNAKEKWLSAVGQTISNPPKISDSVTKELDEICLTYEVDDWMAGILRHSKIEKLEE